MTLHYRDPMAAMAWLEKAFGFEPELQVVDARGVLVHARLACDGAQITLGPEAPDLQLSPLSMGRRNSQTVAIRFTRDIDAHCAAARSAGARILSAPRQEFYGDATYVAVDLEGHIWSFAQTTAEGGPPPEGWTIRFGRGEGT